MIQIADILRFLRDGGVPFTFQGDESTLLDRFSSLNHYRKGSFTWVGRQENIPAGLDLRDVTLAFVAEDVHGEFANYIRTPQPRRAFFFTIEQFYSEEEERPAIGQYTYISPKVKLGENVRIGHNCTLDGDITIGDGTVIWNNVTIINRVRIGKNCDIHSGVVIGHDGFGYTEDAEHRKTMIKHFGGVTIGDNVYIGDLSYVERGAIDDTIIGSGTKIDGLCIVGHNSALSENVAMVTGSLLLGSVKIGDNGYIASALVRDQCRIGDNAFVGLGSVVVKDVPAGATVAGNPARPFHKK